MYVTFNKCSRKGNYLKAKKAMTSQYFYNGVTQISEFIITLKTYINIIVIFKMF